MAEAPRAAGVEYGASGVVPPHIPTKTPQAQETTELGHVGLKLIPCLFQE